ncbi:MAG: LPS export ABC transporter periplasmic protein LptC [Flavobacteriales bacterium]|nr:LPS export ABC transporter periplasmic protein LptC [Flavobacteriales bacterium]
MKIKKYSQIVTLIILMVGVFISCNKNEIEKIRLVTAQEELPSESSTNVEILFSDSAQLTLRLIAPKLNRYETENPYMEFTEGLKLLFYNDLEEPESQIECNYAINYINKKIMEAKDDVVVINKAGEKLTTEHLIWDQGKQIITTDKFVSITTADETLTGKGLEAAEDFSTYKILHPSGEFLIDDEPQDTTDEDTE